MIIMLSCNALQLSRWHFFKRNGDEADIYIYIYKFFFFFFNLFGLFDPAKIL